MTIFFRRVVLGAVLFALMLATMLAGGAPGQAAPAPRGEPDPFRAALAAGGVEPGDLGFRPRSYWARFPNAAEIPFKPLLFDDLFAEPTRLYDVVRIMALAAEDYLDPRYDQAHAGSLYKLAYFVGIEKKVAGFRNYGHTQTARIPACEPLVAAIRATFERRGRAFDYHVMGRPADWPRHEEAVRHAVKDLHPKLRVALARAVLELLEARRWVDIALRNVDARDALAVWRIRDLTETQFDAMEYHPAVEDTARALDEPSLYYAGMRTIQAAERLERDLLALGKEAAAPGKEGLGGSKPRLELETPMGRLIVGGTGHDVHEARGAFLIVDLGGDDEYRGPAGATSSLDVPVAVCLDLAGNDRYVNRDRLAPAQGAAVLGAGVLIDSAGDDHYVSRYLAQGSAQFGTGLLADRAGDDRYEMEIMGQGAGVFGVGMLIDASGHDTYRLFGDGQGYGGVGGGVGSLVDASGNDSYFAEPDARKVSRVDYHHGGRDINYGYVQGVGIGRRGDMTDGHAWAGGTGTLIDLAGDDTYESGTWALGCSYWYGIGLFYDKAGNDTYKPCSWSLASGAHFGISAFVDEAGDDRYLGHRRVNQVLGFGHDYIVALFLDRAGDDIYRAGHSSLGFAQRMSQVFFLDLGGRDRYSFEREDRCLGATDAHRRRARPKLEFTYEIYARQVGLFLDVGGEDTYTRLPPVEPKKPAVPKTRSDSKKGADSKKRAVPKKREGPAPKPAPLRVRNDAVVIRPRADDPAGRHRHHGVFVDRVPGAAPAIPWLADRFDSIHAPRPPKPPAKSP